RAIHAKAAKICTPEFGCKCLGFENQGWADSIRVIPGQNWDVTVHHRTG
ncbi:MAG: hypothetical protein RL460_131, partial [Actinomycetota bacterium]